MLVYCLNKNLDGQKILQDIQNLISKSPQNKDLILVIKVQEIGVDNNNLIPKIEYKPETSL
jgi:hypothetical protein